MADRNEKNFDRDRDLVMNRGALLNGHELIRMAPVVVVDEPTDARGEITEEVAARLWAAGSLDYADELLATPIEDKRTGVAALVTVEDLGSGYHLLRAPWRDEAKKVRGRAKAEQARDDLIEEGMGRVDLRQSLAPSVFQLSEEGSNGWYKITGPGIDGEPLTIRGEQAAMAKRDELEAAHRAAPVGLTGNMAPPPQPDPTASTTTEAERAGAAVS